MPQWNFWEDNISFVVLSCVPTFFVYGRLHREKKDWEKRKMFPHYITGPTTQREEVLCEKEKIKFLFLLLKYATIKFLHKFCSFCSSCVLRETSIGVDYTERRKTEREKRKNVCFPHYIIGGPPQREKKY